MVWPTLGSRTAKEQNRTDAEFIIWGAGSMQRAFIRLSVCLSHLSAASRAAGGFTAEPPAGRRYRSIAASAAYSAAQTHQQQRRRSTALSSKCGQRHVYSRRRRLSRTAISSLQSLKKRAGRTCLENENPCLEKSGSVLQFLQAFMLFYINIQFKLIVSDGLRIAIKHECI